MRVLWGADGNVLVWRHLRADMLTCCSVGSARCLLLCISPEVTLPSRMGRARQRKALGLALPGGLMANMPHAAGSQASGSIRIPRGRSLLSCLHAPSGVY